MPLVIPATPAGAPPKFDAIGTAVTATSTGAALSLSPTVTCSGNNRIIIVFVQMVSNHTAGLLAGYTCKLDGVDQGDYDGARGLNNGLAQRLLMWYMLNPSVGAHTIALAGLDDSSATQLTAVARAIAYNDVGSVSAWSGQSGTGSTARTEDSGVADISGLQLLVQCFGQKSATAHTAYSGTVRGSSTVNLNSQPAEITIGDNTASQPFPITATGASVAWASDFMILNPV